MDTIALILIIVALLIGGAAGWFMGSRPVADWKARHAERDAEAREVDEKFRRAIVDLENATVRAQAADTLADKLEQVRSDRESLAGRLASLESGAEARERALEERYAERERHFERELKRLVDAEEKLQAKFNEIGEKMLEGARSKFLEGAQSHLASLNKESLAELEKKVGPVGETLERYRKRVEELEKNRVSDFERLQGVIGQVREGQERVMEGANRITTTLRGATKARGDWGELQLANLLESCGLYDKADFDFQVSVRGDDSNILRPDAVINIPGSRRLVVDVKNVFNTYARANEADNEEERQELLRTHARELRTHIDELSAKRYQDFVEGSADFVVMFVPGEHVLYAALTQDSGLLDYALKKQIVLSSPLNFMSIALTVSTVWRQAGVQADAQEIAALGKELYDRLGVVAGHLGALRKSLASTNTHFDKLVGSFDTNLRRTGERFEELSIDTSAKDLAEALPIGHQPRRLANFSEEADSAASIEEEERDAAE
ncbi:DNA recombination protein RmuC [Altererythrobacter aurantiacus]|uniref:DNA recombination protein RmuC homolog n=1 Tax=Parapontixanthobacter aurantiacus TaxID=1463599 RepID=A0A844ZC77_9SPHN|nr:DNA recombination protein RmuC [Parapontixanthobacter aurantiacus]MXO84766.1 DNA recombination protein RmuC [Parapontixanthobacter aurantiacus]